MTNEYDFQPLHRMFHRPWDPDPSYTIDPHFVLDPNSYRSYPTKWDFRFLALAKEVSTWSKDPSTQVGCVITNPCDNTIISLGFNGFPKRISDDERLDDRAVKHKMIIHAEMNAILNAKESVTNSVLYTWPWSPCSSCAKHIIQAGISRIVYPEWIKISDHWVEDFNFALDIFKEADVAIYPIKEEEWSERNNQQ